MHAIFWSPEPPVLLSWRGLGKEEKDIGISFSRNMFDWLDSWTKFNTAFFPVGSICRSLQSSLLSSAPFPSSAYNQA